MTGRLVGIARHDRPRGPMETVGQVSVTAAEGLHGDFRGGLAATRPSRKRQVSLIESESWRAALSDLGAELAWWESRRNLLVEDVLLPRDAGTRISIGGSLVLEITEECDPCGRMDELYPGLRAALIPDWRGGRLARVLKDGDIAVGDKVRIEP